MKYRYAINFPRGFKDFEGSDRYSVCESIDSDPLNECDVCGYKLMTVHSLFKKIGKYNPKTFTEDGVRVYQITPVCRECERRKVQAEALKEWYSKGIPDYLRKVRSDNMKKLNNDFESQAKIKRDWALKNLLDKSDTMYLYLAKTSLEGVRKIGITYDLGVRQKWSNASNLYIDMVPIKSGSPAEIINLEYEIKIKYCLRNYEHGNEYVNEGSIEDIKKFSEAYNLPV